MSNTHHVSASKGGVTITAYRGDGSVLLGFDLDKHLAATPRGSPVSRSA